MRYNNININSYVIFMFNLFYMLIYQQKNRNQLLLFFLQMYQQSCLILEQFLKTIIELENVSDNYKAHLNAVDIDLQKLLISLRSRNNMISFGNIEDFLFKNDCQLSQRSFTYIKRYLGFIDEQPLYTHEFINNLQPKNKQKETVSFKYQNPGSIFLDFLEHLSSQRIRLEKIRTKLCDEPLREQIKQYFYKNYSSEQKISKKDLKEFMFDRKIYNRQDYRLVVSYMIGQENNQITWDNFLSKNANSNSEQSRIKFNYSEKQQQSKVLSKEVQVCPPKQLGTRRPSYDNVLADIDNIQKLLANKKDSITNRKFLQLNRKDISIKENQLNFKEKNIGSIQKKISYVNKLKQSRASSTDSKVNQKINNKYKQSIFRETAQENPLQLNNNKERLRQYRLQQYDQDPLQSRIQQIRIKRQKSSRQLARILSKDNFDNRNNQRYNYRLYSPLRQQLSLKPNVTEARLKIREIERRVLNRINNKPDFSYTETYSSILSPRARYYRPSGEKYDHFDYRITRY